MSRKKLNSIRRKPKDASRRMYKNSKRDAQKGFDVLLFCLKKDWEKEHTPKIIQ